jgi:glutathione S-transferase
MITLYQFEISPFCDKIRRILHVKRQPYEIREIPVSRAFSEVRRVNRMGKLPCIEHDGHRIADSTDIAYYLEEKFPDPPLIPSDPLERARCHVLEDWADESLYFYEMTLRFTLPHNARRFVPPLVAHDPPWFQRLARFIGPRTMKRITRTQGVGRKPLETLVRDVERQIEALSGLLGDRQWLVGGTLTLADIAVFAQLYCIRAADEGGKIVDGHSSVAAWMDRVDRATLESPS